MSFEEGLKHNEEYLNTIDLLPYLKVGEDLRDIMWNISEDYDSKV